MITLYSAIASVFFALIALLSYFYNKSKASDSTAQNNAVETQISALDTQLKANQNQVSQIQQQTAQQEQGETNASILQSINSSNSSNTPKS